MSKTLGKRLFQRYGQIYDNMFNKKVRSALLCHLPNIYWNCSWSTNCFISLFFFVYFCNFCVKLDGMDFKKKDLESYVHIGHCIFRKFDIVGQNLAWGRLSRFLTNSVTFVFFFKCTNMMISSSLISPLSLSPLSQTLFQNSVSKLQMHI